MKKIIIIIILVIFITACVGPEEPLDGLIKNSPVIVNTNESFTFSLRGASYTTEENYNLTLTNLNPIELTTVLVVTDFAGKTSDTSYFEIFNSNDSLIVHYLLTNNINVATVEQATIEAIPNKIFLNADNFTGVVQLVIAIGD